MRLLEIRSLSVKYGAVTALRSVDLAVDEGEVVSVLGSNGAGKSTLLKAISGEQPVESGSILFQGQELADLPTDRVIQRGIAYVPEGRQLFPNLTVNENLAVGGLHLAAAPRKQALSQVLELFPVLGERLRQKAGTMSGGEQQMLAVGRALMAQPKLLLLDEMSLGVAPLIVNRLFEVVTDLRNSGTTVLLVEQNVNGALAVADRGYVLEVGEMVLAGAAAQLRDNPDVQRAYLGM